MARMSFAPAPSSGGGGGGGGFDGVLAYANTDQELAASGFARLALQAEIADTASFHDPATNNSRLTVPADKGGLYRIWAGVSLYVPSAAANIIAHVYKNSTGAPESGTRLLRAPDRLDSTSGEIFISFDILAPLAVADFVELAMWPATTVYARGLADVLNTFFGMERVGD
jgi:hypothetical protein